LRKSTLIAVLARQIALVCRANGETEWIFNLRGAEGSGQFVKEMGFLVCRMIDVSPFPQAGDELFVSAISLITACQVKPGGLAIGIEEVDGTRKRTGNQSVVPV
jgi:hypothetical protein